MKKEFIKNKEVDQEDFKTTNYVPLGKEVYLKAGDMMSDKGYQESNLASVIRARMKRDGKRFWANDNISDYLHESDKEHLINEATDAFEKVLDALLIDRETDPSSNGTARRLAKMYINAVSYTHLTLPTIYSV